jgi:hypothetical protein
VLHNGLGLFAAKVTGLTLAKRKPIAIDIGKQNSGLGAALVTAYFSPLAAVPSAIFSVWHDISGALLANWFAGRKDEAAREARAENSTRIFRTEEDMGAALRRGGSCIASPSAKMCGSGSECVRSASPCARTGCRADYSRCFRSNSPCRGGDGFHVELHRSRHLPKSCQ